MKLRCNAFVFGLIRGEVIDEIRGMVNRRHNTFAHKITITTSNQNVPLSQAMGQQELGSWCLLVCGRPGLFLFPACIDYSIVASVELLKSLRKVIALMPGDCCAQQTGAVDHLVWKHCLIDYLGDGGPAPYL
jgi:hypothetical protein